MTELPVISERSTHKPLRRPEKAHSVRAGKTGAGTLHQTVRISLHTRIACSLWAGRPRQPGCRHPALPGVFQFAARVHAISRVAAGGDQCAQQRLHLVENALRQGRGQLQYLSESIELYVARQLPAGVCADVPVSGEVQQFEVRFATPQGFMAAYLLVDFDLVARQVLSARYLALLNATQCHQMLRQAMRIVRVNLQSGYGMSQQTVQGNREPG